MVMPQEEVQDPGRAEHESVGVGRGFVGRRLPRLMEAPAKQRHQHIGNVRRALTPALLPQYATRLEVDLADACETVALTEAVAAQRRRRSAECHSQVLLRNAGNALGLRDTQPAECNARRSMTPPDAGRRTRIALRPLPSAGGSALGTTDQPSFGSPPRSLGGRHTCGCG